MVSPLICIFPHQEEEEEEEDNDHPGSSPGSTPGGSRRTSFCRKRNKDSKNPYSTRGLDKFSALLAELEEKKQQIYSQTDSDNISLVRFVYSNENDCVPIVVKLKDKEKEKTKQKPETHDSDGKKEVKRRETESHKKPEKRSLTWDMKLREWRRPSYYLPVIGILILLFLALFGRSFAVLCTCIGWYLVPVINGRISNLNRPMKKKEHARRRSSENKLTSNGLSSPRSTNSLPVKDKLPHSHQKSW